MGPFEFKSAGQSFACGAGVACYLPNSVKKKLKPKMQK